MAELVRSIEQITDARIGRSKEFDLRDILIASTQRTSTYGASLYAEDPHPTEKGNKYTHYNPGDGKGNEQGNPMQSYLSSKSTGGKYDAQVGGLFLHSGPTCDEVPGKGDGYSHWITDGRGE